MLFLHLGWCICVRTLRPFSYIAQETATLSHNSTCINVFVLIVVLIVPFYKEGDFFLNIQDKHAFFGKFKPTPSNLIESIDTCQRKKHSNDGMFQIFFILSMFYFHIYYPLFGQILYNSSIDTFDLVYPYSIHQIFPQLKIYSGKTHLLFPNIINLF